MAVIQAQTSLSVLLLSTPRGSSTSSYVSQTGPDWKNAPPGCLPFRWTGESRVIGGRFPPQTVTLVGVPFGAGLQVQSRVQLGAPAPRVRSIRTRVLLLRPLTPAAEDILGALGIAGDELEAGGGFAQRILAGGIYLTDGPAKQGIGNPVAQGSPCRVRPTGRSNKITSPEQEISCLLRGYSALGNTLWRNRAHW